jgi:hypothetical protein
LIKLQRAPHCMLQCGDSPSATWVSVR